MNLGQSLRDWAGSEEGMSSVVSLGTDGRSADVVQVALRCEKQQLGLCQCLDFSWHCHLTTSAYKSCVYIQ